MTEACAQRIVLPSALSACSAFQLPVLGSEVLAYTVDSDPAAWVKPLHLGDLTGEIESLFFAAYTRTYDSNI